jgi:hypothetical protein
MSVFIAASFPFDTGADLDFRPASYVADWCATAAVVQNIVGEQRREVVHQRLAAGTLRPPLDRRLLADRLTPSVRAALVASDPLLFVSGEGLPRYRGGEMEIARLVLATTPRLVFSLRAQAMAPAADTPEPGGPVMRYRLVGEADARLPLASTQAAGTLALGDLVRLIDSADTTSLIDAPRHIPAPERLLYWRWQTECDVRALPRFVRVSSVVYPELGAFYRERLRWWVTRHLAGPGDAVPFAPPLAQALEAAWRWDARRRE